uniref:piezo-type mechanosensitive ion channel component 2 n=1 Tax=Myxine glutinosa TaxID=7769 RepID=UPI00358F3C92
MASQVVCGLLFRLLLPLCLITACLFRFDTFSFIYLIFLLLVPLVPEPTPQTLRGWTGTFIRALCCSSFMFLVAHLCFQITVTVKYAYGQLQLPYNSELLSQEVVAWLNDVGLDLNPLEDVSPALIPMKGVGLGLNPTKDVGLGLNPMKDVGLGLNPMKDVGLGLNPMKDVGLGLNPMKDVGLGLNPMKDVGRGLNPMKDVSLGLNPMKDVGLGLNPTKDVGLGLNPMKDVGLGLNPMKDVGRGLNPMKDVSLGLNPMKGVGLDLNPTKDASLALIPMKDLGLDLNPMKDVGLGLNPMKDLGRGLNPMKDVGLGLNPMKDLGRGLNPMKDVGLGLNPMKDLGRGLNPMKDLGLGLNPMKDVDLGLNPMKDLGRGLNPMKDVGLGLNPMKDVDLGLNPMKQQLNHMKDVGRGLNPMKDVGLGLNPMKDVGLGLNPMKDVGLGLNPMKDVGLGLNPMKDVGLGLNPMKDVGLGLNPMKDVGLGLNLKNNDGGLGLDPMKDGGLGLDPMKDGGLGMDPMKDGGLGLDPMKDGGLGLDPMKDGGLGHIRCIYEETLVRHFGLVRIHDADWGNVIRLFAPDFAVFTLALITLVLCWKLEYPPPSVPTSCSSSSEGSLQDLKEWDPGAPDKRGDVLEKGGEQKNYLVERIEEMEEEQEQEEEEEEGLDDYEEDEEEYEEEEEGLFTSRKRQILEKIASIASDLKELTGKIIETAGKVVTTFLLGLAGIIHPSLTNSVYFIMFMGLASWWASGRVVSPVVFSSLCILAAIFSAGHLFCLFLYQLQRFQQFVPPSDIYARLFGITGVVRTDCARPWELAVHSGLSWPVFMNPIVLLILYFTIATLLRLWLYEPAAEPKPLLNSLVENQRNHVDGSLPGYVPQSLRHSPMQDAYYNSPALDVYRNLPANHVPLHGCYNAGATFEGDDGARIVRGSGSLDLVSPASLASPDYIDLAVESPDSTSQDDSPLEKCSEVEEKTPQKEQSSLSTIGYFLMQQSYVSALIAMMAWSITYHSWLTFVLLLWSCLIWMVRDRRRYTIISSPFLVIYANTLCCLAYVWSLRLTDAELPPTLGPVQLPPIGLVKEDNPCLHLGQKLMYTFTFWMLLRQRAKERQDMEKEKECEMAGVTVTAPEDPSTDAGSDVIRLIGSMVRAMFIKYWIYICGGMFFFVSLEGRLVTYKIIYMMLCLACVALYQVHYHWWRRILKYFWMGVVCYTMLVTVLIYTYQFEYFPALWKNMTGLSDTQLRDLGLEQFSVSKLFAQILIPTAFLLCCILQLHYFHTDFLHLTDLDDIGIKTDNIIYRLASQGNSLPDISAASYEGGSVGASNPCSEKHEEMEDSAQEVLEEKNKWTLVIDRLTVLLLKFFDTLHRIQVLCWRILELHIIKIVAFSIIWIVLKEVSLLNYPFIILWSFALPFPSLRPLASSICTVWTCVVIICKMIYQLDTIEPLAYSSNCTMPLLNETNIEENLLRASVLYVSPVDPAAWVGIRKSHPVITYIKDHVSILAVLLVEITVYRHQYYYRRHNSLEPPLMATLFEGVTRKQLDQGIPSCIRYFVNNFFYKFGLEACFLMAVNTIGQRMDLYATVHGAWLLALLSRRRRKAIAEAWPRYCTFLSALITWQYLLCIGMPPALCKEYPWRFAGEKFNTMLVKWLFIPDYALPPNPVMIIYDAMMLLLASQQMRVFEDENKAVVRLKVGDNLEVCWTLDGATFSQHNPVPDFIHSRSYLDMIKVMLFSYLFWCVLIVIFFAGTMRISLFCLGYLVGCFYFLLFGGQLLLQPVRHTIRLWDYIIAYNVMVIFMKNVLSIGACAYLPTLSYFCCWLVQAFSLVCTIKGYDSPLCSLFSDDIVVKDECELPRAEAGIIWDAICFFFLLLQRRAFLSYYFLHVVADLKASTLLACRGAELIQAEVVKTVKARLLEEEKSMQQLKRQMERIIARQQKIQKGKEQRPSDQEQTPNPKEAEPEGEKTKKNKQWWRPWVDHASMMHSGEYYLFESDSEDEDGEEEGEESAERTGNGMEPQKKSVFQHALGKVISSMLALPKHILKLPQRVLGWVVRGIKFAYTAWVTDSKSALKEREQEHRQRHRRKKHERQNSVDELSDDGLISTEDEDENRPDNILRRLVYILKFIWVLLLALVDGVVDSLNSLAQDSINISRVLRIERCMLSHEAKMGKVPTKDSINNYYKAQILARSRDCSIDGDDGPLGQRESPGTPLGPGLRPTGSRHSMLTADSSPSSCITEATMLWSRQTAEGRLGMGTRPGHEQQRPQLHRAMNIDGSTSSIDSSSQLLSEGTQCTPLFSRQGTGDTIEEDSDGEIERDPQKEAHADGGETPADIPSSEIPLDCPPSPSSSAFPPNIAPIPGSLVPHSYSDTEDRTSLDTSPSSECFPSVFPQFEFRDHPTESLPMELTSSATPSQSSPSGTPSAQLHSSELLSSEFPPSGFSPSELPFSESSPSHQPPAYIPSEFSSTNHLFQSPPRDFPPLEFAYGRSEIRSDEHPIDFPFPQLQSTSAEETATSLSEEMLLQQTPVGFPLGETPTELPFANEAPPTYSKAGSLDCFTIGSGSGGLLKTPGSVEKTLLPKTDELTASELLLNKMFYDEGLEASDHFYGSQTRFLKVFFALYNTVVARSEMLCFFVMILNHVVSASCVTLVLPILIFLWAMLSMPRPSKHFWMTTILYTEITVVIKYFFQFGFFPWNSEASLTYNADQPFFAPAIIGVEKKEGYVYYDLVQLLTLFFHRSILKCHGLWDDVAQGTETAQCDNGAEKEGYGQQDEQEWIGGETGSVRSGFQPSVPSSSDAGRISSCVPRCQRPTQLCFRSSRLPAPACLSGTRRRSSGLSQVSGVSQPLSSLHNCKNGENRRSSGRSSAQASAHLSGRLVKLSRKELIKRRARRHFLRARSFVIARVLQVYRPIRQFFYNIIHPEYSPVTDVYALMFMADVVDFIVIIFGYGAFGKHSASADITSTLSEDQVPEAFLVMLLIQFGTMVVDRALYLRKTILGKCIFQVVLVFGIHFWMFFILPKVTERKFNQNMVAQVWYFVKCIYFGLSAYQIRCGYPTRILGNFLTKSYNYLNLFLFQGFRLVPFLIELRAIMDWVWTETTLSLSSWICIEDIYANIFILKCWRESEKRYPQPRGQKKKKIVKYGMGGMIVFVLICIVWFPLLFMSLVKSVAGVLNPPLDVSVSLSLGGYQPMYKMSAQQHSLKTFTRAEFNALTRKFSRSGTAMQFITIHTSDDLVTADLEGNSTGVWGISPPSQDKLVEELLLNDSDITIRFYWSIRRDPNLKAKAEVTKQKHTIDLNGTNPIRAQLAALLQGKQTQPVRVPGLLPPYIRAPSGPDAHPVRQLLPNGVSDYSSVDLLLMTKNESGRVEQWWSLRQVRDECPQKRCDDIKIVIFSDRVSPPSLGFLAGYGIMGLYASVVLVVGKFVREFFSGISHSIMFEELPNVDRVLKLCTDIFLVRETGELQLEEDLFAKLIFLYRSPETMIKWTREKGD